MRAGSDALNLPGTRPLTPPEQLRQAADRGREGLFFRTMLHVSPTLDRGPLRKTRSEATTRRRGPVHGRSHASHVRRERGLDEGRRLSSVFVVGDARRTNSDFRPGFPTGWIHASTLTE
jgi:hypothetical protein